MRQEAAEMIPSPLDRDYFEWLVSQIRPGNPEKTYLGMFEFMHNKEYIWFIPNDDSRVGDGKHLRNDYFRDVVGRRYRKVDLHINGVSFLEVLVGLSRRMEFQIGRQSAAEWAWHLIKNLKLNRMSDPLSPEKLEKIDWILETVIWRNYDRTGHGGFFPLKRSIDDQRKIDVWYQLQAYSMEIKGMQ